MRSTALLLFSALCAAVYCSPTPTNAPPVLSYEVVQKDPSGRLSFAGPNGIYLPYNDTHYSFHGSHDTTTSKRSGEIEGIALKARQSGCGTSCHANYANAADITDAEHGLANHFDQGYTYFQGNIVYKTNNVYAFGCDYGNGQTYSSGQYWVDISCVTNACGPSQAGWNSHHVWKSTYGRDVDSFSC
ncbi:hypothetical protein BS47DRAFT_1358823 [Hydnum rufescens UP504]|uniref:Uncharacterized protein n=1 Tax=Hydnum rufescens UP504 TaxID=1448309 RepID=A0A9P6B6G7_9AGAM|nr:hypothetical protein BS47DRAFT_1358823 [Hydnum rufescens UP504]